MFPKNEEFWDLINNFDKIIVLFDNDSAGIRAAQDLVRLINFPEMTRASSVHLPTDLLSKGISDPSDMVHKRSEQELINFLKAKKILL